MYSSYREKFDIREVWYDLEREGAWVMPKDDSIDVTVTLGGFFGTTREEVIENVALSIDSYCQLLTLDVKDARFCPVSGEPFEEVEFVVSMPEPYEISSL